MSNLVIVAIPREDDPVWQISSEKKPHMTICFLGEAEGKPLNEIAGFVAHASKMMLTRFGLDVDRRGELGDDKADVVFFQDNWELPRVREFREALLKDNNIKKAYDSVEQYPIWTPHLTLGYPEAPAKRTSERIYWVQFDRIAVWTGDYEGIEFVLDNDYAMEVAMSDTAAAGRQFLAHYGVKGMRWGVRKGESTTEVGARATQSLIRGKAKIKTTGGERKPPAADAIKAAEHKQILKKSGVAALSNKDLAELGTRLQLETNVKRLTSETEGAGKKFIKRELQNQGQNLAREAVKTGVKEATKQAGKVAAEAALAGKTPRRRR